MDGISQNKELFLSEQNLLTLQDFSNHINSTYNNEFIFNTILLTCFGKFLISKGAIYLLEGEKYTLKYSKGFKETDLLSQINITQDFTVESLKNKLKFEENIYYEPFIVSNKILGFILLGPKINNLSLDKEEQKILTTIVNISSPAIENSIHIEKLKNVNSALNYKISQMNSLVELSKEFSLLLDEKKICKVFSYVIFGNLLIDKYSIVKKKGNNFEIIDGSYPNEVVDNLMNLDVIKKINFITNSEDIKDNKKNYLLDHQIELVVPMFIRNEISGYVFLGAKKTKKKFTENEKEFIDSLASIAITALENSYLFAQSLEKQKIEDDLAIGKEIQTNLFPKILPKSDVFELIGINISSRQVGGDYYDIFKINIDEILILIADVSGKGVGASLIMANLQAFVKILVKSDHFNLTDATTELNNLLCENLSGGKFVTFFWGILNERQKTLKYVNAGHNPPILIHNDEIKLLDQGGIILGVIKSEIPYVSETINLESGDFLLLYTDGVNESKNINDEEFGEERIIEFAKANKFESFNLIKDNLINEINYFSKGTEQYDDITSIMVRVLS